MPSLSSVHIDRALTDVSIMYRNEFYIADQVLPILPVNKRSDKYFVYDPTMMLSGTTLDANGKPKSYRRPKSRPAEIDYTLSANPFFAEQYVLAELVDDESVAEADSPLQPEIDATEMLTDRIKLDCEIQAARLMFTTTNYPSANKVTLTTGGSGTSWASYSSANSKPLNNIRDGRTQVRKSIMRDANTLLMTQDVALTLADHPDIKDLIKYTNPDALTESGLPKKVRGLTVVEGSAQKNTSAEGAAFSGGNVWVDENGYSCALVLYVGSGAGPRSMHYGRTFEAPDATTGARGFSVRKYRDDPRRGLVVECGVTRAWQAIAVDSNSKAIGGYLIDSAMV